jgi:hypothetical protein
MQMEGSTPPADLEPDWRTPYLDCLIRGDLPPDKTEARWIACRAKTFVIHGNDKELYRRSPIGILQRCIMIKEGRNLLKDLHSGACGHHAAPQTLVENAFQQGFYWPTTVSDALSWYAPTKDAITMQGKPISWLMPCKPFPSYGHSPFGGLTWLDT